ncbi:MAG: NAD(P)-dependent oxidoreductase [Candidatus Hodarchaeota archaeon]
MKLKCLITAAFNPEGLEILGKYMEIHYESWRKTRRFYWGSEILERMSEINANALIVEVDAIDEDAVEKANPEFIGCCREGVSNIAVDTATDLGIPVFYTPGRNSDAVADLTIGHIISSLRRMTLADRILRSGIEIESQEGFIKYYNRLTGHEISGNTIGIIGLGKIGTKVAQRLRGFDVTLLVYDPYVKKERIKEIGGMGVDLETLLRESDIITVHCVVNPETIDLIGEDEISLMKPTAFLFNLASSVIVNEQALYQALKEKRIAGAGLDVFDREPVDSDNIFLDLDNVTITPHIGGATYEVIRNHTRIISDDIKTYMEGKRPKFVANPQVLDKARKV